MSPYKSLAQEGFFHTNPKMAKYVKEWDKASKGKHLPKRVKKVKKSKKK